MAKKGLGKGLNALISNPRVEDTAPTPGGDVIVTLKLMDVEPNSNQPRKAFDDEALNELSQSIKEHGVISPIIVSPPVNGYYKIIAGERRWRASKLAGQKTIPAIIKEYDDADLYEVALIENLQRQDLNPVEEAMGYKKLMDDFNLTQEKISERLSKSRSSIANSLRLLSLSKTALEYLAKGNISTGHAKILVALDSKMQTKLAKEVAEKLLSVRELEVMVKQLSKKPKPQVKKDYNLMLAFEEIEKKISNSLSTKVKIANSKNGKGKITIDYYSTEDLERITNLLANDGK